MRTPVIDVCDILFDHQAWVAYLLQFAQYAPRYLVVFADVFGRRWGFDPVWFREQVESGPVAAVRQVGRLCDLGEDPQERVELLRSSGVLVQVLHGGDWQLSPESLETVNDRVAALASRWPGVFVAWAGLNLSDPERALSQIDRCCGDLGMTGLSVIPFLDGASPDGPEAEPVLALAEDEDLPIWIHTGQNFGRHPLELNDWAVIDRIASRHPGLRVIAGHGGWPNILHMVAICQRHPNVYLDISSHHPRRMSAPGSGWEPLLLHGRSTIRDQVLFGSVSWVHGQPARELAEEVAALVHERAIAQRWLYRNGSRLLGIDAGKAMEAVK